MANDQLNLFTELLPQKYAVVFYSCRMEDQFGDVWERKEIYSSGLTRFAADRLAGQKNSEIFRLPTGAFLSTEVLTQVEAQAGGKTDRYEVEEIKNPNFLIS